MKEAPYSVDKSCDFTKREIFAMNFMASLTSIYWDTCTEYESGEALVKCQCETAVEMADALLEELLK